MTSPLEIVVCPACRALYRLPGGRDDARLRCGRCHEGFSVAGARRHAHDQETASGLSAAAHLHRYQVIGRIARGGMGEVLRARDGELDREVALKTLLRPKHASLRTRFLAEARLTGQLDHPNIIPVHEMGSDDQGRPFFAMKLIDGRSLADVIAELRDGDAAALKRWTLPRLLTVFIGVCNGVAYAHDRDIVHRDLKPANIMLGSFGEVWVLDWGLAKRLRPATAGVPTGSPSASPAVGAHNDGSSSSSARPAIPAAPSAAEAPTLCAHGSAEGELTLDGHVLGTPAYMPPEQARGEHAATDQRSDVWALGAMLYEILALRRALPGRSSREQLEAARACAVRRLTVKSGRRPLPAELIAVVDKALAERREDRYQRVTDLRADIEAWLDRRAVSAHHETLWQALWRLGRRHTAAVVAGNLVLAVVIAAAAVVAVHELQRRAERRHAAPAFVAMARAAIDRRDFADALIAAQAALAAEPDRADATLAAVHARIGLADWQGAAEAAERAVGDGVLSEVSRLCRLATTRPPSEVALPLAVVLSRQGAGRLADHLLAGTKELLDRCRQRLDATYPGHRTREAPIGLLDIDLSQVALIGDLEALRDMPIASLRTAHPNRRQKLFSLTALAGMRLVQLDLTNTDVVDLSPLAGMPLTRLALGNTPVRDLAVLAGMPLTRLDLSGCRQIESLAGVHGLALTELDCTGCTQLSDLSPLTGSPLRRLHLGDTAVTTCAALSGLPLELLTLDGTRVSDLTCLAGAPLRSLSLSGCPIDDVQGLAGMPLENLSLRNCTRIDAIDPLAECTLRDLDLTGSAVSDLRPIANQPIERLFLPTASIDPVARAVLLRMSRLVRVNGTPVREALVEEVRRVKR